MRNNPSVRKSLQGRAGFTLVELLIVVSIIGITAAMATPSLLRVVEDRRTQKDAVELLAFVQEARGRSIARGGAVQLQFDATGYRMLEAMSDVTGDGSGDIPLGRCAGAGIIWRNVASTVNSPRSLATVNTGSYSGGPLATLPALTVCFTPRGRMLVNNGGIFVPANQVFSYRFQVLDGGGVVAAARDRWVHLAPNGLARMEL